MGIPFDQYQRYKTIQILVSNVKEYYNIEQLNILEVGSNEQLNLEKFLPNENITYSDLTIPKDIDSNVKFIEADATNLKDINDKQFDIVVSSDVFEHIPEDKRESFLNETTRVAKLLNIHCFPFKSEAITSAELRTNEYYKAIYGADHIWLKEHIENGLPNIEDLECVLNNLNENYFMFEHGDILLWEDMTKSTFYSYFASELISLKDKIDDFYEKNIYLHDIGENNYRKFVVVTKDSNLDNYLDSNIKKVFDSNLPQKYFNFLYKNIDDMQAIAQTPIYKDKLENDAQATLYLDDGNGFNEESKISYCYKSHNSMGNINVFTYIPQNIRNIRFDPIEGKASIINGLSIVSNKGDVDYIIPNGFYVDDYIVFDNSDPQIVINSSENPIEWLKIQANICEFEYEAAIVLLNKLRLIMDKENNIQELNSFLLDKEKIIENKEEVILYNEKIIKDKEEVILYNEKIIEDKERIIKDKEEVILYNEKIIEDKEGVILYNEKIIEDKERIIEDKEEVIRYNEKVIGDKENNIQNLSNELEYYKLHYNAAMAQRNDLTNKLASVEASYNNMLNSTCWKITKPIRVILDYTKKLLKSNRYTHLLCKGLKCLKQNGIKYTLNRVKQKYKISREYSKCLTSQLLTNEERQLQVNTMFSKNTKFSIVVPLYNTPKKFLHDMINSCIYQTYDNWELCLADGSDKNHRYVKKIVNSYMKKDNRIKYRVLEQNGGISENTNECIKMATGEYIGLFDHDDILHPSVLFEYMKVICEQNADFIYCDEDKFETNISICFDSYFKPDFAIDNLRANNYICHFTVFKKELINEAGLFRKEFDGSQDHDMVLRLTEKAKHIVHVQKILYHWRVSSNSVASDPYAKPYTIKAGINAVTEHLNRCNLKAKVESSTVHPNFYRIKYDIIGNPLISILIPNKDHIVDLSKCINSILEKSTYKNIEIIIIENNSTEQETFDYYKSLEKYNNIKIITYESNGKFNYSAINNFGVTFAKGEHLLFLNNDIEIISENWLEEMLMYSQREDVGAVGAKLYYPNDTIQHAGVIMGIGGVAGHSHKYFERNTIGYFGRCALQQNLSAVTAACLMMKKNIFDEINGFDETFEVAFNDVDLCMRIRKEGYLIACTPYAEAYHYESISRGYEDTTEKQERFNGEVTRFQTRWKKELEQGDPYYNPNLTLEREDFSLK